MYHLTKKKKKWLKRRRYMCYMHHNLSSTTQHSKKLLNVDRPTFMNEILDNVNDSFRSVGTIKLEIKKIKLCTYYCLYSCKKF